MPIRPIYCGISNRDRDAQPAKNQRSRITLLRLPAIVRSGFQLTLCQLLRALFSFHQTQLFCEVSTWLLGTVFMLDMYKIVVNSSYVLGSQYHVLARIPGTPHQSDLLQIRHHAPGLLHNLLCQEVAKTVYTTHPCGCLRHQSQSLADFSCQKLIIISTFMSIRDFKFVAFQLILPIGFTLEIEGKNPGGWNL